MRSKIRIRTVRFTFLLVLIVGLSLSALAQETMVNSDVISMTEAGVSPALIISKIRSSVTQFDISTAGLIKLKAAKVDDSVVAAMMNPKEASTADSSGQRPSRIKDELTSSFNRLKTTV